MWRGCGRGRELVAALCTAALAVCRWPVVLFEGFLFTCRCCCRCLGEGFVCVSDRVMRRVMRHMKKVDGNAPLPLEPPPTLPLPLSLPLSSPSLLLPLALPLKSDSQPLSLPLSLPLSSPLFTLPEEEQQHVGQIRATGRLRARVFFSCQFRTVQVAVLVGPEQVVVAVAVAVVVATVHVA